MQPVKHILLLINALSEQDVIIIREALFVERAMPIQLNLVHVVPSLPSYYFTMPSTALLSEKYYLQAEKALDTAAEILQLEKSAQWLMTGKVKTEVIRLARRIGIEFILASAYHLSQIQSALSKKQSHLKLIHPMPHLATL